jgi:hypothetical protein
VGIGSSSIASGSWKPCTTAAFIVWVMTIFLSLR